MRHHYLRWQFAEHIDNCQIEVFAAYASRRGRALVDRELYLPKSWSDHPDRCRAARIPEQLVFATKPDIARTMVTRVLAAGMPVGWVSADDAYGADFKFRQMCEMAGVGYVVAVPNSQQVRADGGTWRIDAVFADAPEPDWEQMSCGDGAKGPRVYDWAAARLPAVPDFDGDQPTHDRWILARRSLDPDKEIAYYLAYAPAGTPVAELVGIAGARWAVEECFQSAKNDCGMDKYEVRRYPGWYRHVTLAMLAHAFLADQAADAAEKGLR